MRKKFKGIMDAEPFCGEWILFAGWQIRWHIPGKKADAGSGQKCLENLYVFLDFVAYCYADSYQEGSLMQVFGAESGDPGSGDGLSDIDLRL